MNGGKRGMKGAESDSERQGMGLRAHLFGENRREINPLQKYPSMKQMRKMWDDRKIQRQ